MLQLGPAAEASSATPLGIVVPSARNLLVEGDAVCIRASVRELCHGWGPVDRSMVGRLKFVPELINDSDEVDVAVDFPPAPGFTVRLSELSLAAESAAPARPSQPRFVWERADGDELCHILGGEDAEGVVGEGEPLRQVRGGVRRAAEDWVAARGAVAADGSAELRAWARRLSVPETPAERAGAGAPLELLCGALVARPGRCGAVRVRGCGVGPDELRRLVPGLLAQAHAHPHMRQREVPRPSSPAPSLCFARVRLCSKIGWE